MTTIMEMRAYSSTGDLPKVCPRCKDLRRKEYRQR